MIKANEEKSGELEVIKMGSAICERRFKESLVTSNLH